MDIQSLWGQFGAAHPIYSHVIALAVGGFIGPKLLAWFEATGIPKAIDWADAHQEALLKRAGLTPEQIHSVREHEVADMRKAADELEARNKPSA